MYDKKIVPGCLAMITRGAFVGRTVRCESVHMAGDSLIIPNGRSAKYTPSADVNVPAWLCIGNVKAAGKGRAIEDGDGFCMIPETNLMRIDHDDDSPLRKEFSIEEASYAMEEQIRREGGKRLW